MVALVFCNVVGSVELLLFLLLLLAVEEGNMERNISRITSSV